MNTITIPLTEPDKAVKLMLAASALPQGKLAKKAHIDPCGLSTAKSSKTVTLNRLQAISKACGCKLELLLTFGE